MTRPHTDTPPHIDVKRDDPKRCCLLTVSHCTVELDVEQIGQLIEALVRQYQALTKTPPLPRKSLGLTVGRG